MTPGKNTVKISPHFCASASSGATPRNGMAASSIVTGRPKIAMRYQLTPTRHRSNWLSRSRTPSLPPVAAVTRKAGTASPKTVASVWTTVSGSSIGRTPNPFSDRRMGIRLVHPNPKAITRKAVAGWRATRRLSVECVVGCWFSVAVDIAYLLFRSGRPGSPCACTQARRSVNGLSHPRLGRHFPCLGCSWLCTGGLVGKTSPGEHREKHGDHRYRRYGDQGSRGAGDEYGRYILATAGRIEGAVEERHDEHAASTAVVEPHDQNPYEHGEHRR